jgi:hypothetical protein
MRKRTGRRAGRPLEHPECGTVQTYWRGCRCNPCRLARNEYYRKLRRLLSMLHGKRMEAWLRAWNYKRA